MRKEYDIYPILSKAEINKINSLTNQYKKFKEPNKIVKQISKIGKYAGDLVPENIKVKFNDSIKALSETDFFRKTIELSGRGFAELQKHAAKVTISKETILKEIQKNNPDIENFEEICTLRSYRIEKILAKKDFKERLISAIEGFITGVPGFLGIPFNIVISFFLYYRVVQNIAMYYGYNVKEDEFELEFAANVLMESLFPNPSEGSENFSGLVGKMMLASNLSTLKSALIKTTYGDMAKKGGTQLLYVKIRALGNAAAKKALTKANKSNLEKNVFKDILTQMGKRMPQKAGKKIIPGISGIIGALTDTYFMSKVIIGSKLIYHKRYLFEKEKRVEILLEGIK